HHVRDRAALVHDATDLLDCRVVVGVNANVRDAPDARQAADGRRRRVHRQVRGALRISRRFQLEIDAAYLRAQHSCNKIGRRALAPYQGRQQRLDRLRRGVLAAAGGRRVRMENVTAGLRRRRRALGGAGDAVELFTRFAR
ncbi:unnamed protein product, partial [Pelagomonas calceolata]